MVRKILTATLAFCALSGAAWGEQTTSSKLPRIVSLAPSVTETLFAVGAGAQLVGVCTFCDFPRAVEHLDRIGSYLAPSVEAIATLTPITSPSIFTSGPPLLPGLIEASVWIAASMGRPLRARQRAEALVDADQLDRRRRGGGRRRAPLPVGEGGGAGHAQGTVGRLSPGSSSPPCSRPP